MVWLCKGCYVRGGTLAANSLREAQHEAILSNATNIMHLIWLKNKAEYALESNWKEIDRKTRGRANKESVLKWVIDNTGRAAANTSVKELIEWIASRFM